MVALSLLRKRGSNRNGECPDPKFSGAFSVCSGSLLAARIVERGECAEMPTPTGS